MSKNISGKETNKIIDTLFSKFQETKKVLKDRIRARNIFYELDKASSRDLNSLIQISKDRASHIKAGSKIKSELADSSKKYWKLTKTVFDKEMYLTNEINKDKSNLKLHCAEKTKGEIDDIFNTLKRSFFPSNGRGYLQKQKQLTNARSTEYIRGGSETTNKNFRKTTKTITKANSTSNILYQNFKVLANVFEKERTKISNNITDYIKFTKGLENQNKAEIRKLAEHEANKTLKEFQRLTMLNYSKPVAEVKVEKTKKNIDFDIKKIMGFTRTGLFSKQNLDLNELKMGLSQKKDYGDTIGVVKKELIEDQDISREFNERAEKVDKLMGFPELPALNDYQIIINSIIRRQKMSIEDMKNKKLRKTLDAYQGKKNKFFKSMSEIYLRKKKIWEEEEKKEVEDEKAQKEIEQNCLKYLRSLDQGKRHIVEFVDPYSLRTGETNQCLKDISVMFGKKLLTKDEIEEKIDQYYTYYNNEQDKLKQENEKKYKEKLEYDREMNIKKKKALIYEPGKTYNDDQNNEGEGEDIDFVKRYFQSDPYSEKLSGKVSSRSKLKKGAHRLKESEERENFSEYIANKLRYVKKHSL